MSDIDCSDVAPYHLTRVTSDMGRVISGLPSAFGAEQGAARTQKPHVPPLRVAKTKGGFIPPPQRVSARRAVVSGENVPYSLVHTTGGIDNIDKTALHTPGPGAYAVPSPPKKRGGLLAAAPRQILTHSGHVDLFKSWNGLGPGSYFRRLDDHGFCGRNRTARVKIPRTTRLPSVKHQAPPQQTQPKSART
eukprot:TRINITY_DN23314_c0_g1_i1.p1 TRINITY_DN23314_c0_g1~~TRINITY_DN23314_c0_g1_i1.p1  ORF type:complete len:191 (+),score=27.17 TRINITY_DN23314_c0_g1_i1:58-630(+)